jgi:hypothetical protein
MRPLFLTVLLTALLVASTASSASAFPESVKEAEFWAPPVMLEGYEYDVMVVLVGYSLEETKFDILSNNENIVSIINREIIIEPLKSHGMAKVKAKSEGKVDLFAVSGDTLVTASIEVTEPALMPAKIDLLIPANRVGVNQILAYTFLLDSYDNPLLASEDIEVNVRSFGNIVAQVSKVVIKKDMHYGKFIVDVKGDGGISVAANNLESDTELIEFTSVSDEVELKAKVAPDPIATSSSGEVYVWLEKDGKLVVPEKDVKVTLVSEDSRFLAFSKAVQFSAPLDRDLVSTSKIYIKGGESYAHTMVWTTDFLIKNQEENKSTNQTQVNDEGDTEEITITAIAEGFDSAETDVEIRTPAAKDPNVARIFALPDPAVDKLDIIIGLYFSQDLENEEEEEEEFDDTDSDQEIESDEEEEFECREGNETPTAEEEIAFEQEFDEDEEDDEDQEGCDLIPVTIGESIAAHISTDSLLKAAYETVRLDKGDLDLRDHYSVIPAITTGNLGTSKIFGAADGTIGEEIEIRIEKPYSNIPAIGLKSLPAIANAEQDMFLVYGIEDGIMTDLKIKDLVVSTRPTVLIENIQDVGFLKVVKGRSPEFVSGKTFEVTALAAGFTDTRATVSPFNPETRNIISYHPPTVHSDEPFPMVFYATDEKKNPIEIVEPSISPKNDIIRISGALFILPSSSEHSFVFYGEGMNPGTSKIEAFSHEIKLDVSTLDKKFDLGDEITLTFQVVPTDARVTLDTDLPFIRSGSDFRIESAIAGNHTLVLTAERDGFGSVRKELQIEIRNPMYLNSLSPDALTESGEDKFRFDNLPKPSPMALLAYVGIMVAIAGVIFYMFARKKLNRSPKPASEQDLTY